MLPINIIIWVVKATSGVHVCKNVKHSSISGKQKKGYVRQNATSVIHVIKIITIIIGMYILTIKFTFILILIILN